jgi:hypothetical protein
MSWSASPSPTIRLPVRGERPSAARRCRSARECWLGIARADQQGGHPLGFLNPTPYSLYGNISALYDVLPAGQQDMSRADYASTMDPSNEFLHTTRLIGYEGAEQFCECEATHKRRTRDVAPRFDSMTASALRDAFLQTITAP